MDQFRCSLALWHTEKAYRNQKAKKQKTFLGFSNPAIKCCDVKAYLLSLLFGYVGIAESVSGLLCYI